MRHDRRNELRMVGNSRLIQMASVAEFCYRHKRVLGTRQLDTLTLISAQHYVVP